MTTAFEQAKKWGVVPDYAAVLKVNDGDKDKAREEYRGRLREMQAAYTARAGRRPLKPGPKPEELQPPPFPEASPGSDPEAERVIAEAGAAELEWVRLIVGKASHDRIKDALTRMRSAMTAAQAARDKAVQAAAAEWKLKINDPWLDTEFYPHEAERALWETANHLYEEQRTARRARRLLLQDALREWAPIVLQIGIGIGVVVGAVALVLRGC